VSTLELTAEERAAIAALRRIEKKWPSSLWLFSNGSLAVIKKGPDGQRMVTDTGSIDQDYCVASIAIESDGGDY
jgi:hypothetical protein